MKRQFLAIAFILVVGTFLALGAQYSSSGGGAATQTIGRLNGTCYVNGAPGGTPTLQGAINACGSNSEVIIPTGQTLTVTATQNITNLSQVRLTIQKGATVRAVAGFPVTGGVGVIDIGGTSSDITIDGPGTIDCNNIINASGIITDAGSTVTRVNVRNNLEVMNCNSSAILNNAPGEMAVDAVNVHDSAGGPRSDPAGVGQVGGSIRVTNSRIANITANLNDTHGLSCFAAPRCEFVNNNLSGFTGPGVNPIGGFAVDYINWDGNSVTGVNNASAIAIHADTMGRGQITNNSVSGFTGPGVGIFPEVSSNMVTAYNYVDARGNGADAFAIGGPSQTRPAVQLHSFDNQTNLVAAANVTFSTDAADKQEGTGSTVATMAAGFSTGQIFRRTFAVALPQSSWNPYIELWMKPSVALASGGTQFGISLTATCSNPVTVNLQSMPANQWTRHSFYFSGWGAVTQTGSLSWCVIAVANLSSTNIKFDDARNRIKVTGNIVRGNRALYPAGFCFNVGFDPTSPFGMEGGEFRDNYCEDAQETISAGTRTAYNFSNSTNVAFSGNEAKFTAKIGTTPQTVTVDATSSLNESDTRDTNVTAASRFVVAAGGTVRSMFSRLYANKGTAYSGADAAIVLSAGWGTTRTVSGATGFDQWLTFTANATGVGQAANPTFAITFKDGTWTNTPVCSAYQSNAVAPVAFVTVSARSATSYTFVYNATPTAANSYEFTVQCGGT